MADLKKIEELERYLEEECYSFTGISIGKHHAFEGIVIKEEGNRYVFGFSERGRFDILKSFATEEELVTYALKELESDRWLRGHCVAWTWTEEDIQAAEQELRNRDIAFERNDVPNYDLKHGRAYRIFVFGKDVKKASDFKEKYWKH